MKTTVRSTLYAVALLLAATFSLTAQAEPIDHTDQVVLGQPGVGGPDHWYGNAGVRMTDTEFNLIVAKFRDDVLNDRRAAVAAAIDYPSIAAVGKKRIELRNPRVLLRHYDEIFSPRMIDAIRKSATHDLFSRDQGVMLGNGEVWFNADGKVRVLNAF